MQRDRHRTTREDGDAHHVDQRVELSDNVEAVQFKESREQNKISFKMGGQALKNSSPTVEQNGAE